MSHISFHMKGINRFMLSSTHWEDFSSQLTLRATTECNCNAAPSIFACIHTKPKLIHLQLSHLSSSICNQAWFFFFPSLFRIPQMITISLIVQMIKNLPAMQETRVQSLDQEDPLERKWLLTLVFLPGEFYGQGSLVGYRVRHD